jgi:hypothetical protein
MRTEALRLRVKCPGCDRKLRGFPFMRSATLAENRNCAACGRRWRVVVRPLGPITGGFAHQLDWQPLPVVATKVATRTDFSMRMRGLAKRRRIA